MSLSWEETSCVDCFPFPSPRFRIEGNLLHLHFTDRLAAVIIIIEPHRVISGQDLVNPTHLHLMLSHLPIIGPFLAAILLGWGLWRGSREVVRTALGATVLLAMATYPIYLTGEQAEKQVEHLSWSDEQLVKEHETRAEAALVAMLITGALAALAIWLGRKGNVVPRLAPVTALVGVVVSAGLFAWAALAGGQIRHDEIRSSAAPPAEAESIHEE